MSNSDFSCKQPGLWPSDVPVVIVGSSGLAREFLGICLDLNMGARVLGFLDDNASKHGRREDGFPILGAPEWLTTQAPNDTHYVMGIGSTAARSNLVARLESIHAKPATLISPTASISRFASVAEGAVICAGVIINTHALIGRHCVVNLSCTVGHDAILGDFVTLNPGVNVSGNVTIATGADIGTGSALNQQLNIGSWTILGSGSVVTCDIPDNVTAVGVPARVTKERDAGWQLRGSQ